MLKAIAGILATIGGVAATLGSMGTIIFVFDEAELPGSLIK